MTITENINHQDGSMISAFASIDEPVIPPKETVAIAQSLPPDSSTSRHPWTHLKVPRACKWHPGIPICDDTGSLRFKVLAEGCLGIAMSGPAFHAVIADPESNEPVAFVVKDFTYFFKESYLIYTFAPNYEEQSPDEIMTTESVPGLSQPMFLKASLTQGLFGKKYSYSRNKAENYDDFQVAMEANNPRIPLALFPGFGLPLICAKWKLKFHLVDQWRTIALVRNQKDDTLEFGPDVSPLEGVCISYVIDRLTNPCTFAFWWGIL